MDKKLALLLACCMMGGAVMSCNEVEPFTDPLPACKENVRVCGEQDGKVVAMACHNGQFAVEATCEGATPACDPLKGVCVAAQPSTPVCTANDKKCDTNRVVTCDTDGSKWTVTEDCGSDKVCNETTKTCETPKATDCTLADGSSMDNNTTVCKDGKTYACTDGEVTETACVAPDHATALCAGNTCSFTCDEGYRATEDKTGCELNPVCTAGEKRCTNKNVETCAADGSQWTVTDTCEETESCNATTFECEVPLPDACEVEGVGSVPSGSTVCKDGKTYACTDGEVADTECEAPEHAMATCNGNACGFTCAGDYVVSEDGTSCVEKPCGEGATKCETVGEAPMTSTCEGGVWKEATECTAPSNATAICTTDGIKCDFTCEEGYTKVESSEGVEASCKEVVPPAPTSCTVDGTTIANGETKCIGTRMLTCVNGEVTFENCTTTIENATSACNTDMTACTVTCEDGYEAKGEGDAMVCEEEPACKADVCEVIDGVAKVRVCIFGGLAEATPCSSGYGADPNANYGCNTEGNACAITDCKDGYELKDGACVGMATPELCTDTEGLVGDVSKTYENEWVGCSKDRKSVVSCGAYGADGGYEFKEIACDADKVCNPEAEGYDIYKCIDATTPVDPECTTNDDCIDGDKLFCGDDGKCTDESATKCEVETYTCRGENIEIRCSEIGSTAKVCKEGQTCVDGKGCVDPAECTTNEDCTDGDKLFCGDDGKCTDESATKCEVETYTCRGENVEIWCSEISSTAKVCEEGQTCVDGKGCVADSTPVDPTPSVEKTVIISEIYSTNSQKAIEIYNATDSEVDLSSYKLNVQNKSASTDATLDLSGKLAAGEAFVACAEAITGVECDITGLNGGIGKKWIFQLLNGDAVVDSFGQIGVETKGEGMVARKCGITAGDSNPNDAFDYTAEWEKLESHTLGTHTVTCAPAE